MEVSVHLNASATLLLGTNPGSRWMGSWVGLSAGLGVLE